MPHNFKFILQLEETKQWNTNSPHLLLKAAVAEREGNTSFFSSGKAGDEQASQDIKAEGGGTEFTVPILTVDGIFDHGLKVTPYSGNVKVLNQFQSKSKLDIFLLKIDTEGYDYTALDGAHKMLAAKRVKFLSFEYNSKWFSQGRTKTLKQVSYELYDSFGYECYWILNEALGEWWQEKYEIKNWSNVFYGQKGDTHLKWVVDSNNKLFNLNIILRQPSQQLYFHPVHSIVPHQRLSTIANRRVARLFRG
jgi:FkbM family methyltransferase